MSTSNTAMLTIQIRLAMMAQNFGLKTTWGNYPTASTGPGVVKMPYFDANDPVQVQAAMGFGLHEGAHHRYNTDFGLYAKAALMSKLHKSVFNCIDDGRIDFRAMLEYPGVRSDYEAIESLFISRSLIDPASSDTSLLGVACIYLGQYIAAVVLRYKPSIPLFEETRRVAEEMLSASFLKRVQMIAQMGTQSATCEGCWDATLLFVDSVLDELKQPPSSAPQSAEESDQEAEGEDDESDPEADGQGEDNESDPKAGGQGEDDESEPEAGGQGEDNESDPEADGQGEDDESDPEADGQGEDNESDPKAGGQGEDDESEPEAGGQGEDDESEPEAGGQALGNPSEMDPQAQAAQLEELVPNFNDELSEFEDKGSLLAQLIKPDSSAANQTPIRPDIQINTWTQRVGKSQHFDSVKTTANLLTQSLAELVEAETNIAPSSGRRGKRFILAKKQRYLQGDLRVYRTKSIEKGVDSAITIALDMSGSMGAVQLEAKNACLSVALAVEQIEGAKICVQSFSGVGNYELISFDDDVEMASGRFDSIIADDGTPMREGLSNAFLSLMGIEAERKTVIVITDGYPDIPCESTFQVVRDYGVDVFGIYIGEYAKAKSSMDHYFTPHGWIAVRSMFDLKRELFKLAKNTILPAA